MKKNLIIGGFSGYEYPQVQRWVESVCAVADSNTDKVMAIGKTSQETQDKLISMGFILIDMPIADNIPVHVLRFICIYEFLKTRYTNYKYVVTTDVRDVIFQRNPFEWIVNYMDPRKSLIAASESMKYKDEPWGNQNLMETYGPYIYENFKFNEIYNVGVLAGESEYIKDLVFNIFVNGVNRPIPIVDQAVYNVMIQTQPFKDAIDFVSHDSGWACQLGTTGDPRKIDYFRENLLGPEPVYKDGAVYTSSGEKYYIVHQYDRVPDWKL